jgi:hypothetical protein
MIDEPHPKGFSSCLWCDLRFKICRTYSPGSENELIDVESFSDDDVEVEKKAPTDSVVAPDAGGGASQPSSPKDRASPEFTEDLERTVQRGDGLADDLPLVETHGKIPEGQDPSPSVVAFNERFGTSFREELLSVSCETALMDGGASRLSLLWKSSKFMDDTGGDASPKMLRLSGKATCDSEKQPSSSLKKTSAVPEHVVQAPLETLSKKCLHAISSSLVTTLIFPIIFTFSFASLV